LEIGEYKTIFDVEETHWWYRALHDIICSTAGELFPDNRNIKILDAGCGTGFLLKRLSSYGEAFGLDISPVAVEYCRKRNLKNIVQASLTRIPFKDESFDLVVSADVLYHKGIDDDQNAINEIFRVLKKGGYALINVAAHDYLRRPFDKRVHTRHRYSLAELSEKMKKGRFELLKISYRNSFLFPVIAVLSLFVGPEKENSASDLKYSAGVFGRFFYTLLKMENRLLKKINMPFGTSVFCVAGKR
jgi:SAM-dependent methyltransferase